MKGNLREKCKGLWILYQLIYNPAKLTELE